ncbi:hypothetical protein [Planococcus sp. CAU13]|uniref:hypothetical protein n=1 Tax=Planococcus sp. CAU13 TaxID=1541197 RepID=UPI00052FE07D|nr:hypothetical protein [Planococcus sp. CAU13]
MKKVLITLLLILLLFFGFIAIRFGSALGQEGNPVPYLMAIAKYEFTDAGFEEVLDSGNEIRYVSAAGQDDRFGVIFDFMAAEGWQFTEQLGSGLIFNKGEETVVIETRQYSSHYFIWDVPKDITE